MKRYYYIEFTYDGILKCQYLNHSVYMDKHCALVKLLEKVDFLGKKKECLDKISKEDKSLTDFGCTDTYQENGTFKVVVTSDYIEKSKDWIYTTSHNLIDMIRKVLIKEERIYNINSLVD